jgi:hypothetical protein
MNFSHFSREKFLKGSLLGSIALSIPSFLSTLGAESSEDIEFARKDPLGYADSNRINDPILKIVLAGITAPNSHNTQPWKIKLDSKNSFLLFADKNRQLLPIDPINRQLYHSQGTFLEFASLAAAELGFVSKISLFPRGVDTLKNTGKSPVAKFSIEKSSKVIKEEIFKALPNRQMNRGEYSGDYISKETISKFDPIMKNRPTQIQHILGESKVEEFLTIFIQSFSDEIASPERNNVTRDWFRITSNDIYAKRDGITLEGNGLQEPILWLAKNFFLDLSPEGWNSESSLDQSNEAFSKGVNSSKGLVFFISKGTDNPKTWVDVGRDFARYSLACAHLNLSFHTMNQALVDYPESLKYHHILKQKLNLPASARIQLAGRIGEYKQSFVSPRRDIKEFLT